MLGRQGIKRRATQIKDDSVANDLVRRVMKAIDEWAKANELMRTEIYYV